MTITPKVMIDAAAAISIGGAAEMHLFDEPEQALEACMKALVAVMKELAVELSDRFDDSADAAHLAALDALDIDACSRLKLTVSKAPPRVVMRREVERDTEGRISALVDLRTD